MNAPELVGQSRTFLDALAHASAAAAVERPILIVGERGSGKELLAARLHYLSPRWEGPLVKVNCAAMNEELLESELFGHEAGAFTGAMKKHAGRFERANGGTLFLDEIPSASARVQEKLLRVIEYGEYERIGGEKTLTADVRVVAAANVDLRELAARGDFRADLLDRLAFDVVLAPPLRDRRDDIPLLAAHFGAKMAAELGITFPGFSPEATQLMLAHRWPGNVRELKNVAERAVFHYARSGDAGTITDLTLDPFARADRLNLQAPAPEQKSAVAAAPEAGHELTGAIDLRERLDNIEKELAVAALRKSRGNQKAAADILNLTYDQIRGIIRKHEIDVKKLA